MASAANQNITPSMGWLNWMLLLLLSFFWGGSFALNEVLLQELPPVSIVWGRQIVACMVFIPICLPYLSQVSWSFALFWRLTVMGLFAIAVPFSLFAFGQQYITSVLAGIGNGTVPLFTMLIATLLLPDERMTRFTFLGLMCGFFGIVLLFMPMLSLGDFASAWGLMATVCASMMYGFCNVFARSLPRIPVQVQGFVINAVAAVALTPVMLWEGPDFAAVSMQGYGFIVAHGVLGSCFAYLLYLTMIKRVGSVNTSQVAYLMPFAALLLGVLWLGEDVSIQAICALALVIIGLWVKDRSQKTAPAR